MVPCGVLLGWSLIEQDTPFRESVSTAVAGVITIVPEGLVLLVAVTYAVATMRMARRGALSQQLNAVESLASTDVICLDKTGTLTEEALRVVALVAGDGRRRGRALGASLGRFAASSPGSTSTLDAIEGPRARRARADRGQRAVRLAPALERHRASAAAPT